MDRTVAGIAGGAGYTGGELIRILLGHPGVRIAWVLSKSHAGQPLHKVHQDLVGQTDATFAERPTETPDVLFLCMGHGESRRYLLENEVAPDTRVIDLSQDFRLPGSNILGDRSFVYGLPELEREAIRNARNVANPGCFATAIQLGLLPLAKAGLLDEVATTGITGSTGAGQSLSPTSHFSWRADNISAYKTLEHQHIAEITASLRKLQPDRTPNVHFIPWRGDFTRGIFISSQLRCEAGLDDIRRLYDDHYADHPFTHTTRDTVFLKQAVNTNQCLIQLEQSGDRLVVHSVIDNLLKGASGQAVQNMNLMFGHDETAGLRLKASYF
jgi:N-acetyl-gamma-glutamyl-phosphate reductase